MKEIPKFYLTDVFTVGKYSGNQLATFVNCKDFSDEEMQKIAREVHFSETTFITSHSINKGDYDVRIFTPVQELPFAGHPTLGTAYVIRNFIALGLPSKVVLNMKVGQIPVTFEDGLCWMKQVEPQFGEIIDKSQIADILGLDIDEFDASFPVQDVSTGIPILIAPIKTLDSLKKIKIDKTKYFDLVNKISAKAIYVFCPQGYEKDQDLSARMFVDYFGIPEDPATGSACGCLAAYLINTNYYKTDSISKEVGQGYEIKRPSRLFLKAEKQGESINIHIGGNVQKIAEGYWGED